jgi:hypothetical protein
MDDIHIYLQQHFDLPAVIHQKPDDMERVLAEKINDLIKNNFNHLVYLLYRMDVDESRLKQLLKDNPDEDAGRMIARLVIERQLQKIKTRASFKNNKNDPEDAEKW